MVGLTRARGEAPAHFSVGLLLMEVDLVLCRLVSCWEMQKRRAGVLTASLPAVSSQSSICLLLLLLLAFSFSLPRYSSLPPPMHTLSFFFRVGLQARRGPLIPGARARQICAGSLAARPPVAPPRLPCGW